MAAYPVIFNAEIESADIRFDRGFILSCWVFLKWDGAGQGFGGYVLGGSPFDDALCANHEEQPNFAADFIGGVLAVAGVESFHDLPGKIVRVGKAKDFGDILAIGHPTKERWYEPRERLRGRRIMACTRHSQACRPLPLAPRAVRRPGEGRARLPSLSPVLGLLRAHAATFGTRHTVNELWFGFWSIMAVFVALLGAAVIL